MIKNAIRKYIKTKVQMVLCVSKEVDVFQNESITIFCKRDAILARGVTKKSLYLYRNPRMSLSNQTFGFSLFIHSPVLRSYIKLQSEYKLITPCSYLLCLIG